MKKRLVLAGLVLVLLNSLLVGCGSSATPIPTPPAQGPLPGGTGPDDWPGAGHDARHTAYNSGAAQLNPGTVAGFGLRWTFEAAGPLQTSPAVAGDSLYLNTGRGRLVALNRADGVLRWQYQYAGTSRSSPTVAANKVFLADDGGNVVALEVSSGKPVWQRRLDRPIWASPTVEGTALYLATLAGPGGEPGKLIVLDLESGAVLWDYTLPQGGFRSTPAVAGGAFYLPETVSQSSGGVIRISKENRPLNFENNLLNLPTIYANGQLYVATGRGLGALPAEQRLASPTWFVAANLEATKTDAPVAAALTADSLIVPFNNAGGASVLKNLALKDGATRWEWKSEGLLSSVAVSSGGVIVVATIEGRIIALEAGYGRELWSYRTGGPLLTPPVIAGDNLYIGGQDGQLYAFGPGQSPPPAPAGLQIYNANGANGPAQIYTLDAAGKSSPLLKDDFARPSPDEAQWRTFPAAAKGLAVSPDGRKIAFVSYSAASQQAKTNLFLMNSDGTNPQPLGDANALPQDLAWSPDGTELFFTSARVNRLFSLKLNGPNQAEARSPVIEFGNISLPRVSTDGRFVYFISYNAGRERGPAGLGRVDRNGANPLLLAREDRPISGLAASADNHYLAYSLDFDNKKPGQIWLRRTTGEQPRQIAEGNGPLAFSPDNRWLSFGSATPGNDRKLLALDSQANVLPIANSSYPLAGPLTNLGWAVSTSPTTPDAGPLQAGLSDPTLIYTDPAGKYIFASNGQLYLMNSSATAIALLPGQPPGRNSAPRFSADGQHVVFVNEANGPASSQVWLWSLGSNPPYQLTFKGRNWWPALSQDGSQVAFSSQRDNLSAAEIFGLRVDATNPHAADEQARRLTDLTTGAYQPYWHTDNIILFTGLSVKNAAGASVKPVANMWRLSLNNAAETYPLTLLDETSDPQHLGLMFPLTVPGQNGFYMTRLLAGENGSNRLEAAFLNGSTGQLEVRPSECVGYSQVVLLNNNSREMTCISDAALIKAGSIDWLAALVQGQIPAGGIWSGLSLKSPGETPAPAYSVLSGTRFPVDGLTWGR